MRTNDFQNMTRGVELGLHVRKAARSILDGTHTLADYSEDIGYSHGEIALQVLCFMRSDAAQAQHEIDCDSESELPLAARKMWA